jgi:hypothetical protein
VADRLSLIMRLGALAADAAQRGDDRAAAIARDAAELLMQDHAIVDKAERRQRSDRERKPVKNPRIPRNTAESAESESASQGFSPTPPFPNSPETSRDTARSEADAMYAESVENLTGMLVSRVGSCWPDIDGFIKRRPYATWKGWMKEMLTVLTGGSATAEDLAQVCRDDAALERAIGSPKGLRTFVASAVRERTAPVTQHPPARGGVANRTFANGRDALRGLP